MLLAGVTACAAVLAAPAPSPRGEVMDLVGASVPEQGVQGTPDVVPTPAPAAAVIPTPGPAAGAASLPAPAPPGVPPRPPAIPDLAMADLPGPTAPPVEMLEGYAWPIAHPRLTQPYGPSIYGSRVVDGKPFHDGIDIATFCGDRILAAHAGTVLAAGRRFDQHIGWVGDLGPYLRRLDRKRLWEALPIVVVIDDGNGYRSMYAHLSRVTVKPGDRVKPGRLLGYEGATGRASGCHLHYGLFSPWERDSIAIRPDIVKRMKLPAREIARIDPLLVLPPRKGIP